MNNRCQRRAFLRGFGTVALGLPLLDVFAPKGAAATAAGAPRFAVFTHQANGVAQASGEEPERFWPRTVGPISAASLNAEPDRTLARLSSHAHRLLLVRGLCYGNTGPSCGHQSAFSQLLTGADSWQDPDSALITALGESIDNRIASAFNPDGREPLTLLTPSVISLGMNMSYRGPKQPRAVETNPWTAYLRMTGLTGADQAATALIAQRRKSVNDLVRTQLNAFLGRTDLSREDRRRLDLHLSSVRDVEVKLACTMADMSERKLDDAAVVDERNYVTLTRLHMDLIALSCACDYSRAATLSMGGCGAATKLQLPGFPNGSNAVNYHQISHRIYYDDAGGHAIKAAQDMHHDVDNLHADLFVYLLDKLAAYSVPGGNLLDQGVAIWANELGDGPRHALHNMPWIIAGSAGGYLRQALYVDAGNVSHNRLLNTLLNAVGVRKADGSLVDDFGDPKLDKGQIEALVA